MKNKVSDELKAAANTYEEKNEEYGDAYKRHGDIMVGMFPEGVELNTPEDCNRYSILNMIAGKLNRYAANFEYGGHSDSLRDISVYAAMLQEIDDA